MEQRSDTQICPICQHHNEPDAQRCAQCGVSLLGNTTTMRVSDAQVEQVLGDLNYTPPVHREAVAEGLVFYIAGEVQPVIVRGRDEVILGRHVEEGQPPPDVVDLGTYHGHLLGVSRRHARVKLSGEECLLEDLNSTNGTWLNEKRLNSGTPYILNNGDQIRLGQLILFVYYSMTSARQKVTLKASAFAAAVLPRAAVPVMRLTEETLTYVQALMDLQKAIDRVQGRSVDEKRDVSLLEVDGEKAVVNLTLVGVADAVGVVQQVINPWQKEHASLLVALWKGEDPGPALAAERPRAVKVPETSPLVPSAEVPTELDVAAPVTSEMQSGESEMSQSAMITDPDAEISAIQPSTIEMDIPTFSPEEVPADPFARVPKIPSDAADDEAASADTEALAGVDAESPESHDPAEAVTEPDDSVQQAALEAVQQALVGHVLRHIKAGFGAVSGQDRAYLVVLDAPVKTLSHSTLEVTKSSY